MKRILLVMIALLFVNNSFAQLPEVSDRLRQKIQSMDPLGYVRTLVLLRDRVDIISLDQQLYQNRSTLDLRARTVINTLRYKSSQTQGPILSYLESEKQNGKVKQLISYWITNLIFVEATPDIIQRLAMRNDIELLDLDQLITTDEVVFEGFANDNVATVENGLKVIKADSLWARGFTGTGRVVMNIDGGVDVNHVALGSRWMGNNGAQWYHAWFDPISPVSQQPFDCGSHGTHTMGIMCGMEPGDTVGVAPNANWIAAGITDCPGASYPSMNILAYEWAMDPDSNINTMDMPDVINCSWRDPFVSNECTSIYVTTLAAVEAVGTAVVFSAGNSGPGASTITPPKNINIDSVHTFCVGNINGNVPFPYPITSSSSRGPSLCGGVGTLLIKPEVSAPGTSVRATIPGGYGLKTGTSMASPHVAGGVALLRQVAPNMTGKEIKAILLTTATDLGDPGEDNTFGRGVINLNAAYLQLGPNIQHTPLPNTENLSGPYTVNAVVNSPIAPLSFVRLFWGRGGLTDSITMTNSGGNNWTANIPGNGAPAEYRYYIKAQDNQGRIGLAPGDAPSGYFSFMAETDLTPPSITHSEIGAVPIINWPVTAGAEVTDNLAVDSVWVRWYINTPSVIKQFKLTAAGNNQYAGQFNSTNPEVNVGDTVFYRIYANDVSSASNIDSSALYKITFLNKFFLEEFPVTTFNTANWANFTSGVEIIDVTGVSTGTFSHPVPSGPYFLTVRGTNGSLESQSIDLSAFNSVRLIMFESEHDLESGENVTLEFFNSGNSWETLNIFNGTNNGFGTFEPFDSVSFNLPANALHAGFKMRYRASTNMATTDEWFFDNICLLGDVSTNLTNNNIGSIPERYNLNQNYPNPFNPSTKISFDIPVTSLVSLKIYDITGREVQRLVNSSLNAGSYTFIFDGSRLSSGVYYYRIEAGDFVQTKKMLLIK